jgi:thioredoxin-related protein
MKKILVLLLLISSFSFAEVSTKDDIKMLSKRIDDVLVTIKENNKILLKMMDMNQKATNKRFEDMQKYSDKRFDDANKRFVTTHPIKTKKNNLNSISNDSLFFLSK